ncbi:DUF4268 domain-containing protein [Paenibacillus sp. J5C_2022]|uniref:DUF4268 domain-containing protein n=1 Tax=Paenibacillus sp. J5C2022 TaxID=2977129 RepID=UPI0021CE0C20|nr:DUF4268 domain-containing protein [Paenibacillus sp. J5C2022]MCU6709383.1 DUF4268 domain-containing protein [Paenibacillus sp. J5C2022]
MSIGKLEPVPLRDIWKHEERDFSSWLEGNIELLSETLNITFSAVEREKRVGSFEVDLVAEDDDGNVVIIENQLESTNHDHLGKVITYLTNLDAKTAIWIVSHPRPEHTKAITWLNESTPADISFYLVKLSAYKTGNSEPAPLFTIVVGPSAQAKEIGKEKQDMAERHVLRLKFWGGLLERARQIGFNLHANRSATKYMALGTGAGKAGLYLNYTVWSEDKTGIELYIDTSDHTRNKNIFDTLYNQKQLVEDKFGESLIWDRLDIKRASRIQYLLNMGGLKSDESNWPQIQTTMIEKMKKFHAALQPLIKDIQE